MKLLICTPGRSGSGIMSKFIHRLGYKFADKAIGWVEGLDSGYEDKDVWSKHHEFTPDKYEELKNHIKQFEYVDVVKDPRLINLFDNECMILKAWYEVYPDVKSLFLYRRPYQIPCSFNRQVTEDEVGNIRKKLDKFITLSLSMNHKFNILLFPEWLENYDLVYQSLNQLGIEFGYESGKKIFDGLIYVNMVHVNKYDQNTEKWVGN
jgi:hypothetical protein